MVTTSLRGRENTINKDSCICQPCEQDFKNGATKDNYVPRWKRRQQENQKCIVANCSTETNFIKTTICTSEDVAQLYDINPAMESTESTSSISTLVLCTEHYKSMHMYMHSNDSMYVSKIRCKTCHSNIKFAASRRCKHASHINAYYQAHRELDVDDRVCTSCYNDHLIILKSTPSYISSDVDLQDIIHQLSVNNSCTDYDVHISIALSFTISKLGELLLKRLAILLPELYNIFISNAVITANENGISADVHNISMSLQKKQFLVKIINSFGRHLNCACHKLSQGVLLYRAGSDMSQTLTNTLAHIRKQGGSLLNCSQSRSGMNIIETAYDKVIDTLHRQSDKLV